MVDSNAREHVSVGQRLVSRIKRFTDISNTATALLAKHQWSDTAHGAYGSTARRCPECKGINPEDSLNDGGGRRTHGKGHQPGCAIAEALAGYEPEETPETQ